LQMDEAWPSQTRARESPRPRPQTRRSRPRAPTAWRKCGQAWHSVGKLWLGGVFSRDLFTIQSWCEKVLGTSYLEPSSLRLCAVAERHHSSPSKAMGMALRCSTDCQKSSFSASLSSEPASHRASPVGGTQLSPSAASMPAQLPSMTTSTDSAADLDAGQTSEGVNCAPSHPREKGGADGPPNSDCAATAGGRGGGGGTVAVAGWRSTRSASYCLRLLGLIWGQLTHELCQPWLIHLVHGLASSHLTLDCRQEVHAPAIFSLLRLEPQAGAGGMCGVMVVRR
jgi:hypothetical protein